MYSKAVRNINLMKSHMNHQRDVQVIMPKQNIKTVKIHMKPHVLEMHLTAKENKDWPKGLIASLRGPP